MGDGKLAVDVTVKRASRLRRSVAHLEALPERSTKRHFNFLTLGNHIKLTSKMASSAHLETVFAMGSGLAFSLFPVLDWGGTLRSHMGGG